MKGEKESRKQSKKADKVSSTSTQKGNKKEPADTGVNNGKSTDAMKARQGEFLKHLVQNQYNISVACQKTGIIRKTFYLWKENDPEFLDKYEETMEARIDEWERCLHKNILAGSETSVIFGLKTKGKERGYNEKETQSAKVVKILEDVIAGTLTVREAAYKVNAMGLPLPEVLKIEMSKQEPEEPETPPAASEEDLDKKYEEGFARANGQREHFLPQRQAEVQELKENMKKVDSFGPDSEKF